MRDIREDLLEEGTDCNRKRP